MRPYRPSRTYRPEDRPPPGPATLASVVVTALAALYAVTPMLAFSGLFAAAVCWHAVRASG